MPRDKRSVGRGSHQHPLLPKDNLPTSEREKKEKKRHSGEWSAGDFMDDSVVTDRIGEKSELRVKGREAAERGCRGTGRWKKKKVLSCLIDNGKWEEKNRSEF